MGSIVKLSVIMLILLVGVFLGTFSKKEKNNGWLKGKHNAPNEEVWEVGIFRINIRLSVVVSAHPPIISEPKQRWICSKYKQN